MGGGFNGFLGLISDLRNNEDRSPFIYYQRSDGFLLIYNVKGDQWVAVAGNLVGAVQSFTSGFFMSGQGPRGTIAAGATTTSIPLTTALPATVGVNQLANRGDGRGFKVRIIGNSAGSSGKTEERIITANTGQTTTPTLTLDSPLSFIPIAGDAYEFLSGRVYGLGNTNAAGMWKYYDVLTNSISVNLSTVNLPASISDSILVGLDEQLVPYDRNPGEGFKGLLVATATGAASITGQAAGGDATVLANEHRNFQIRIVRDTGTPTAVGQRRNITSHTAGPSPVYTVSAWAVQPSATATYVIENNGDRIIAWVAGNTGTFTYTISGNAWDLNTTFAIRPAAGGTSQFAFQSFGIEPDSASNARHSFIFSFRGGSTSTLDLFDISGAATGLWTSAITYGNSTTTFTTTSSTYDPTTMQGRYIYAHPTTTAPLQIVRFDMKNRILEPYSSIRNTNLIDTSNSKNMAYTVFVDGNTKLSFIFYGNTVPAGIPPVTCMYGLPITR